MAGNSIKGVLGDNNGNLWLSTNKGISKFEIEKGRFKNYNTLDGLEPNEYWPDVQCKTTDGQLLFGGNYGLVIFDPSQIKDNLYIPKLRLKGFKISNKEVPIGGENSPLKSHISLSQEITLKYYQNDFSIDYVALTNTSSKKSEYAYQLVGFEDDWNYVRNKQEASYTNIDPGNYTFVVKASNSDGYWNEEGTSIEIEVLPAPWFTVWAYSFYAIVLLLIAYQIWKYWTERIKNKKELELNDLKINFFANVSHEFRTPLALILTPLEKIIQSNKYPEEEEQHLLIHRNAKRLLNLVNQLLDFQKIGTNQLQLKRSVTDVVSFTEELLHSFDDLTQSKNISLEFHTEIDSLRSTFDYNKLEKVLLNLLSNACKFTPENGKITLSINKEKDSLTIKVKDSGIGIAPEHLENIFNRFYQIDTPNVTNREGSGIGLSLAKEYVELHGGQLTVESTLGEGSCFSVKLPLEKIEEGTLPLHKPNVIKNKKAWFKKETEVKHSRKTPNLLVVEDNEDFRKFLVGNLKGKFNVIEAKNGQEGWEEVINNFPDLIISDIMMPVMDGNSLCKKVKEDIRTSHIPVILLTAQTSEESQVQVFESGADQYVSKPFNFDVLESRIHSLLEQRTKLQQAFSKKLEANPTDAKVESIDEKLIQKALIFIENNISNSNLTVEELSSELDISRGHLYRKVQMLTGKSPSDFIRAVRLKRASQLLESSNLTISEIAYEVGFSNPKYFSKCFKAEYKVLPSVYASNKKTETKIDI
ncbi:hybrid sensor histidine kinase/response regulator transcription factor [Flammeovirga sp. SJP92]|uniref:hybrid sensor histidine kinase/response regulator transcription factor n=1 Tax=Flammeovirga sp. SJP92 TaxID=1775430 RepID=UPI0007873B74|nr:hybrid sensor histidine kinase/response regulator transcription factor [Flammeovirga sp. SJP92]KXX71289.1 hypothetical protein AVL50_09545 [Flammeovirga sp. SJP92]